MKECTRVLIVVLAVCFLVMPTFLDAEAQEERTIRIIGTSDIHGQLENWDYFSDSPISKSKRGMAKICTYVNQARTENPGTIVIDNGDSIQGTPANYLYNALRSNARNPVAAAMNLIGYDSMTLGNHEFNFGAGVLDKFISEAHFQVLAANVRSIADDSPVFTPYTIKDIDGVKIGIIGLTNPAIPHWERPENIEGLKFTDPTDEAERYALELRSLGADIVVVAAHTGTDSTFGYGREENFALDIANNVSGVDVVLAGHAHTAVNTTANGVLVVEPKNAGMSLCDVTIELTGTGEDWKVSSKDGNVQSLDNVREDPYFLARIAPYHEATRAYVNSPIGMATEPFPGGFTARLRDGPTADLINLIQMDAAAKAGYPVDASCAALFTDSAELPQGEIRLKNAYALYTFDNTLFVVETDGKTVKDVLEWNAQYFNTYDGTTSIPKKNPSFPDYNYDMWSGIEYRIDITKPIGERVSELKLNGAPLSDDQKIRLAVNNYRATSQFIPRGAEVLYSSTAEVRDLIVEYISDHSPLDPKSCFVSNWELYPDLSVTY